MDISSLLDKAIRLGLGAEGAQEFVDKQLKINQDLEAKNQDRLQRLADREDRKRSEELAEKEKEREEREKERNFKLELAQKEIEEREEERRHELELARIKASAGHVPDDSRLIKSLPKIPPFNDSIDEIDVYLQRFEKLAVFHQWEHGEYAMLLGTLLRGKALKVYCGLAPEIANDYNELKSALLKSFKVNPNSYRKKFRETVLENGESYVQLVCRMHQYLDKWMELSEVPQTFEGVCDFMVMDQFLSNCSRELRAFLLEKTNFNAHDMAVCADRYMIAHGVSKCKKTKVKTEKNTNSGTKAVSITNSNVKCHLCGEVGHIRPQCPENPRNFAERKSKTEYVVPKISVALAREEKPVNSIIDHDGRVFGSRAEIVFDTGCNTVVVREELLPKHYKLSKKVKVYNFLGVPVYLPTVKCFIKSKFFTGKVNAIIAPIKCGDVLVGLIPGLKRNVLNGINLINESKSLDECNNYCTVANVVTRSQNVRQNKPVVPLINLVPDINVNPIEFAECQKTCKSLVGIRQNLEAGEEITCRGRVVKYVNINGLIYRKCVQSRNECDVDRMQLVVPLKYREAVMKLGHESLLSGHFSSRKTIDKILHKFFWPNAGAEITRFCKSCHTCQKFGSKVQKVPLSKMPIISEPFSRVAVDLIGPISPPSERGHKYILTLIDLATRYPEAIPLRNIDSVTVAESLVEIFCRVGVPREILSDRGTQFKSDLMSEVNRLLSIKSTFY